MAHPYPVGNDFCVEPTRLGTEYHEAVSEPRHDQLTSLLEIVDNVLGRARWEASVRMTELHMFLRDFSTGEEFLVTLSNTKITREELLVCLDQRPKKQDAKTHALSVFGDGMKSAHNCLVGGKGVGKTAVARSVAPALGYGRSRTRQLFCFKDMSARDLLQRRRVASRA